MIVDTQEGGACLALRVRWCGVRSTKCIVGFSQLSFMVRKGVVGGVSGAHWNVFEVVLWPKSH